MPARPDLPDLPDRPDPAGPGAEPRRDGQRGAAGEQPAARPSGFELGTDGPTVILVGFDDSDSAWRALHYAIGLARRQRSRIVAVYASQLPGFSYGGTVIPDAAMFLRPELGAVVERIGREHAVEVSFVSAAGDPAFVLTQVAAQCRADLIVVGASTKAGHRIFGSIALRTVRARRCPVTVVP
ncbi:MAG: universal stress protein [Streptosporangiaceae bacterium]